MADEAQRGGPASETYDDRPFLTEALPPEVREPLAPFGGEAPPAPEWFKTALAREPERGRVESLGSSLEVLTWGQLGKPGLLFVHGNTAHADWWSFIAPFFADGYRIAAFSLAGMGASDWRERYSLADFAQDAEAVAQAAGLYDGGRKPIYIGHSFGGGQVFFAAAQHPERMHAAILVDTGFKGPPPEVVAQHERRMAQIRSNPTADPGGKVYPALDQALARFRLMPPQPAGNLYIADYIARRSLKQVSRDDGAGEGWSWRFDPQMWAKFDRDAAPPPVELGPTITTPMAHIYGDRSAIVEQRASGAPNPLPPHAFEIEIPDSHHHVMVDQPLALVAAIRALLATWPA